MELTQVLLLTSILLEASIIFLLIIINKVIKSAIMTSQAVLDNVAKDALVRLDKLLEEVGELRKDIINVSAERSEGTSSTKVKVASSYRDRASEEEEKEGGIRLDITHPAVRQWYEYLKKLEKERKREKTSKG